MKYKIIEWGEVVDYTPNFKSVVDLRKWLIRNYPWGPNTVYLCPATIPDWVPWYTFYTYKDGSFGWMNENKAYTLLTRDGRTKGYK